MGSDVFGYDIGAEFQKIFFEFWDTFELMLVLDV
jgi:hypothetical protein